jgi:hypothetical protein
VSVFITLLIFVLINVRDNGGMVSPTGSYLLQVSAEHQSLSKLGTKMHG